MNSTRRLLHACLGLLCLTAAALPLRALAEEQPLFRLDLGGGADSFGANYADPGYQHHRTGLEGSGFVELGYRASPAFTVLLGYEALSPLQRFEQRFNAGFYWGLSERLVVNASVTFAPARQIVARWDLLAGAELELLPWLSLTATARHLDFPSDDLSGIPSGHDTVTTLTPGLRFSLVPRTTLNVQAGLSHHTGTYASGSGEQTIPNTAFASLRAEYQLLETVSLSATGTYGGESRRPFSPGLVGVIASVGLGARWQFDPRRAIRVDLVHEAFESEYVRNGASTALTSKF